MGLHSVRYKVRQSGPVEAADTRALPRVLLVHTDLEGGGPQRVVRRLALRCDPERFQVGLCYSIMSRPAPPEALLARLREAGVDLYFVPGRHPLLDPRYLPALVRAVRDFAPDIVNLHTASMAIVGGLLRPLARQPVFQYSDHTPIDARDTPWLSNWQRLALRLVAPRMHQVVCVASEAGRVMADQFGIAPERMRVVPTGIDIPDTDALPAARERTRRALGIARDEKILGSIGMMDKRKGYHDLLEAFASAGAALHDWRMVLFGDGRDLDQLRALARQRGLDQQVIFTGYWEGSAMEALAALNLYVHPSYMEAMSAAIIEAAACQLPIVGSSVCGNTDVVFPGENGWLFAPGDREALSSAIVEACRLNPAEREAMGRVSRQRALGFSTEKMVRAYEELWSELAAKGGQP